MFHVQNNEKSNTRIPEKPNPGAEGKFVTQEISIFQATTVEESTLNLLFFPNLTWGMVPPWSEYKKFRDYQCI